MRGMKANLNITAMLKAGIEKSTKKQYGLPVVTMPNGREYIVASNDEERMEACKAAVLLGAWNYRSDTISEITGIDEGVVRNLQDNGNKQEASEAIYKLIEDCYGIEKFINALPTESLIAYNGIEIDTGSGFTLYEADMLYKEKA